MRALENRLVKFLVELSLAAFIVLALAYCTYLGALR
jgi:hypothetical protein